MVRPRWFPTLAAMATGIASVAPTLASAQQRWPTVRGGLWTAYRGGYGWASWSCSTCAPASARGSWTGSWRIGGTISPHVLIGTDFNLWGLSAPVHSVGNLADGMCGLAAEAFFYPRATGGFFVNGGVGFSTVGDSAAGTLGLGPALVAGLGYDAPIGSKRVGTTWDATTVSVTPVVNLYYGALGRLTDPRNGAVRAHQWKQHILDFGLGMTLQRRRPA